MSAKLKEKIAPVTIQDYNSEIGILLSVALFENRGWSCKDRTPGSLHYFKILHFDIVVNLVFCQIPSFAITEHTLRLIYLCTCDKN